MTRFDEDDSYSNTADGVYKRLHNDLLKGVYEQDQDLTERKLAADYSVSRTPIREAIHRLQNDGILRVGLRTIRINTPTLAEAKDIYDTREVLEGLTARMAAKRVSLGEIPPSELKKLNSTNESMLEAASNDDADLASQYNLDLHKRVARLANNQSARVALERLWGRIAISSLSNLSETEWRNAVTDHHSQIINAISDGLADEAEELMKRHIHQASDKYTS